MSKSKNKLKKACFVRSDCPVSCALDIIGDKWTMLVVRDLFLGKHRFSEFMESKEAQPSGIVSIELLYNRISFRDVTEPNSDGTEPESSLSFKYK